MIPQLRVYAKQAPTLQPSVVMLDRNVILFAALLAAQASAEFGNLDLIATTLKDVQEFQNERSIATIPQTGWKRTDKVEPIQNSHVVANRAPAVLPKYEPGLAAFTEPPTSSFGDRGEKTFATLRNPGPQGGDENEDPDQNQVESQTETSEAFEERLSDLAGRQEPFTYEDYVDYRNFLAEQGGPLEQLDLSASDFKRKAEAIFEGFEKRDVSNETAARKENYRDFLKETQDPAQRLIGVPKVRSHKKVARPKPGH